MTETIRQQMKSRKTKNSIDDRRHRSPGSDRQTSGFGAIGSTDPRARNLGYNLRGCPPAYARARPLTSETLEVGR